MITAALSGVVSANVPGYMWRTVLQARTGTVGPMDRSERFGELVARADDEVPLDEAALLIAGHARPELDVDAELARLDELAAGCRTPTLDGLVAHLFTDLGYAGNRGNYYDPRNSYLDQVVTRRLGIPITLSVLAIVVG